jgi:putative oxidoreductase
MDWLRRLGRLCLAVIFIVGGWDAARSPGGRPQKVAALGLPEPELLVRANGATMVAAGVALAFGRLPRLAALALAGLLVPTTLVGHAFWQETTAAGRAAQRIQFLKNLGLFGGLLLVVAARKEPSDA